MQELNNCFECRNKCCVDVLVFAFSILFSFIIGVIVGGLTGIIAIVGLTVLVISAIILLLLILIRIINVKCFNKC